MLFYGRMAIFTVMATLFLLNIGQVMAGNEAVLTVELKPAEAVEAGGAWSVNGGQSWFETGKTVKLDPGGYRVFFRSVKGYDRIAPLAITAKAKVHERVSARYARSATGAQLTVRMSPPEAIGGGAGWRMGDDQDWLTPSHTVSLEAGQYKIEFKPVPGLIEPAAMEVRMADGQTTTISVSYGTAMAEESNGTLMVTIEPKEAVADGAEWTINAGTHYWPSGHGQRVGTGRHLIMAKEVPGWRVPYDVETWVNENQTVRERLIYRRR